MMKQETLSRHILPCSATMVGVCMTTIGLVKILEGRIGPSRVDEYLSLDSIVFLVSALFAYLNLRSNADQEMTSIFERLADRIFIVGLTILAVIAVLFAYEAI